MSCGQDLCSSLSRDPDARPRSLGRRAPSASDQSAGTTSSKALEIRLSRSDGRQPSRPTPRPTIAITIGPNRAAQGNNQSIAISLRQLEELLNLATHFGESLKGSRLLCGNALRAVSGGDGTSCARFDLTRWKALWVRALVGTYGNRHMRADTVRARQQRSPTRPKAPGLRTAPRGRASLWRDGTSPADERGTDSPQGAEEPSPDKFR